MGKKTAGKIVPIEGMHCRSCEIHIEKNISSLPGVVSVSVSRASGAAEIRYEGTVPDADIRKAIEDAGYRIGSGAGSAPFVAKDFASYAELLIGAGSLFILFVAADAFGLFELSLQFDQSPELPVVLVIGLAAGASTCMALVGGLVLSVSARYSKLHPESGRWSKMKPHLAFNLGRTASYFLLGGLAGLLGAAFTISGAALGLLIAGAGLIMAWLGLKLVDIFPRISDWNFGLPNSLARKLGLNRDVGEYSHSRAFITGALTFFVPCGFTQAMQLYAVSTGSFMHGALIMALFALGTAPGLLGIGALTSAARGAWGRVFFKAIGVLVIFLGLWNARSGLAVAGVSLPGFGEKEGAMAAEIQNGVQTVRMEQGGNGYSPNLFTVRSGIPVRWIIDSKNPFTCAAYLIVPELGIRKSLERGENVIEFTPSKPGTIRFSCSMGMYAGTIVVLE